MSDFNAAQVLAEAYTLYKKHYDGMGLDFKIAIAQVREESEQRGAVMVMDALKREASDPNWEGIVQPGRSLQELVDHIEHGIRADQMEGDDE